MIFYVNLVEIESFRDHIGKGFTLRTNFVIEFLFTNMIQQEFKINAQEKNSKKKRKDNNNKLTWHSGWPTLCGYSPLSLAVAMT
jgi:hypothetical protein